MHRKELRLTGRLFGRQNRVDHGIGQQSLVVALDNLHGQPPHVFDQHNAQRDGHRPQLANHQRLHVLIGPHIARKHRPRHQTVGMRDIGPSQPKNPGISCKRTIFQLGQLAVIAGGQIILDLAQLLFDQMKVIKQPFCGGGDRLLGPHRLRTGPVRPKQLLCVIVYTCA